MTLLDIDWGFYLMIVIAVAGLTIAASLAFFLATYLRQRMLIAQQHRISAMNIYRDKKAIFSSDLDLVLADPNEFYGLDLKFYDRTQAWLESLGFRFVADNRSLTLSRIYPDFATFSRSMMSDDGTIVANFYHFRHRFAPEGGEPRPGELMTKTLEFSSGFSDGTICNTHKNPSIAHSKIPPEIHRHFMDEATSDEDLLNGHRRNIAKYLNEHPGVSAVVLPPKFEELIKYTNREHQLKCAHLKSMGYVTLDELLALAPQNKKGVKLIFKNIQKLQAAE